MGFFDFFKKKEKAVPEKKEVEEEKHYDKFCPFCGAGMMEGDQFCSNCGKIINEGKVLSATTHTIKTETGFLDVSVKIEEVPDSKRKDKGTYTRNGIVYHQYEETKDGFTSGWSVPEYNEVLCFYTFLNKYRTIKKPEFLKEADYPHMMFNNIGIDKVKKLHTELFEKGFYSKASNKEILETYKVGEIKEVISKCQLDIRGKKDDLISDLVAKANPEQLSQLLGDSYLSISDYGRKWMEDHQLEYEFYTSNEEFDSFEEYKKVRSKYSEEDLDMKRCLKEIKKDKKDFGRYTYDEIIGLLREKEGKEKDILLCLLKELLIDLSGALNYDDWKSVGFDKKIVQECVQIYFTPYLLKELPKYKTYYSEDMIEEAYSISLPMNICSKETYKEIVEMMLDGTLDGQTRQDYCSELKKLASEFGLSKSKN